MVGFVWESPEQGGRGAAGQRVKSERIAKLEQSAPEQGERGLPKNETLSKFFGKRSSRAESERRASSET